MFECETRFSVLSISCLLLNGFFVHVHHKILVQKTTLVKETNMFSTLQGVSFGRFGKRQFLQGRGGMRVLGVCQKGAARKGTCSESTGNPR